jgi:hypothetical protein
MESIVAANDDIMAANDDAFDPNEPTEAAIHAYAATLNEMLIHHQDMNTAFRKKLKVKMSLFGDASRWSKETIQQFDWMTKFTLMVVAKYHLRQGYVAENVTPTQMIDHAYAAMDAVVKFEKQANNCGRN